MKKQFRKQPKYSLQGAEALGSKPHISGFSCYIIWSRAEQTGIEGRLPAARWALPWAHLCHSHCQGRAQLWHWGAAGESPKAAHLCFTTFTLLINLGDSSFYVLKSKSRQLYLRMRLWILPTQIMAFYVVLPANSLCIYTNDSVFKFRQPTQKKATMKSNWLHWYVLKQEVLQEGETFGRKNLHIWF